MAMLAAIAVGVVAYGTNGSIRNTKRSTYPVVAAIVVIAVVTCEICGSMGSSEAPFAVLAAIVVVAAVICSTCGSVRN
ncbi:hypothetical protein ElyMa_003277100 [Elysia marginata]|uniref:Uncharacterized protein n=1 Tax=Elysia marginata TaxID=1093978 RepID=A0AAV4J893_9GAST|nr:hypothetical protein ElyMa_003277100 [Elysia marginata]